MAVLYMQHAHYCPINCVKALKDEKLEDNFTFVFVKQEDKNNKIKLMYVSSSTKCAQQHINQSINQSINQLIFIVA